MQPSLFCLFCMFFWQRASLYSATELPIQILSERPIRQQGSVSIHSRIFLPAFLSPTLSIQRVNSPTSYWWQEFHLLRLFGFYQRTFCLIQRYLLYLLMFPLETLS